MNDLDLIQHLPEMGDSRKAASIKIIGVGGGGGNAANRMFEENIPDVDFIVCNSDKQDLAKSPIKTKIKLGEGLGCGSDAEKGEKYAKESTAEIGELLNDTDMVFITAGMGGGTGTGAAPVIAEISKSKGILTVAIVTLPYKFEGTARFKNAIHGVEALSQNVDSILIINNQTLREQFGELPLRQAFAKADEILSVATKAIAEIMQKTGFVNVDFEDVRAVMKDSGVAVMAAGSAKGENRAFEAIEKTLESPLLNKADIRGAKKILLNITSSEENELTGDELEIIMEYIRQKAETDVDIVWGYMMGAAENGDEIQLTLIATGFEISDIPDFQKPQEPQRIIFDPNKTKNHTNESEDTISKQTPNKDENIGTPTVSHTKFNYGEYRINENEDSIREFESIPAYERRKLTQIKTEGMSPSQKTEIAVANRINEMNPSRVSIDNNSKGLSFGENKYLNHNVD